MKHGSTLKPKDYIFHQKTNKKARFLKKINLQGTFHCNCEKTEDEVVFLEPTVFPNAFFCRTPEEALQGLTTVLS